MKRKIQGLASSTSSSSKKHSWKDDDKQSGADKKESLAFSDSDAEKELEAAAAKAKSSPTDRPYMPNPVAWIDISVADKPRGKIFFELFADSAPEEAELFRQLCTGVLKGTEFHKIVPRKFAEGGDIDLPASAIDAAEKAASRGGEYPAMSHSKAGLLTCKRAGPNGRTTLEFQVTLCASPELDSSQIVFGQLSNSSAVDTEHLHACHWVSAAGRVGEGDSPRDTVLIEDCGVCDGVQAERITGQPQFLEPPFPPPESQEERYSRAGNVHSRLEDALTTDNVADALELTEDLVDYLEFSAKKAKQEGGGGGTRMLRSVGIEAELKELRSVLESAETKAGEVQGFEGKLGRSVKSQQNRIKDLSEILNRVF
jgi:cyclophilin family peptidyl-prolyl cis-trans isomerase